MITKRDTNLRGSYLCEKYTMYCQESCCVIVVTDDYGVLD